MTSVKSTEFELSYLAAPYSHPDPKIVEARMEILCKVDAKLIKAGIFTVSPLMKHYIIHHADLPGDYAFWKNYSDTLLCAVDQVIVIKMPGWEESIGVTAEIRIATDLGIPVVYVDVEGNFCD